MTQEAARYISFSLVEQGVTSLPSALKYLYTITFDLFALELRTFTFLLSNWRLRLNNVGINQYMVNNTTVAKNIRSKAFGTNRKRHITSIPAIPARAEFKITLRSLLRELTIKSTTILAFVYIGIIAQTHKKVSIFFTILLCFLYIPAAFANEECLIAIDKYERLYNIPTGLLKAVSKIESEYNPLALNDGLKTHKFKTKEEVIDRISYLIQVGKTNFDVGCMQINYRWHSKNFTSPEEMLDVTWNVRYAASLIAGLYKDHGSWQAAIRHYHSYEPKFYKIYSKKIALAWLKEK